MKQSNPIYDEPRWRIIAWQHISYVVTSAFFLVSRSKIIHTEDFSIDTKLHYVIASNHISRFDPFMVTTALKWKRLRPLLPCRFIAAPKFLSIKLLETPMRLLGSFPSHPHKDWAYGIEASKALLKQKSTIVIFPQGRLSHDRSLPAKWGVSVLAKEPDTRIIPICIMPRRHAFIAGYTVYVGAPYDGSALTPDEIMARSYSLCE